MAQSIIPFDFHSHPVRIVMRDGEPWFVATDVAKALGYRNAPDAARNLDDHQRNTTQIVRRTSGGNPNVTIISESGLYRLVLRSRKPEALKFSDWVTGEVLPSIRKTGAYRANPAASELDVSAMSNRTRYLVTIDAQGRPAMHPISEDAYALSVDDWTRGITRGDVYLSNKQLTRLAEVCMQKLGQRLTHVIGNAS